MAVLELDGKLIKFLISEDDGATRKRLVCSSSDGVQTQNTVSEKETKCGVFTAIKSAKYSYSGTAVCNANPTANEVSFADIQQYQKARTKLWFLLENDSDSDTGLTEGAAVYNEGYGYFTDSNLTGADGEVVEFTWSFSASGNVDLQFGAGS